MEMGRIMTEKAHKELQELLDYQFNDDSLLLNALTHRSYLYEHSSEISMDNERLEFLGDAVLGLTIAHRLFIEPSRFREGDLSRIRAAIVCEPTLASCARDLGLGSYLRLGKGEDQTGGRDKDSNLSNAIEAVFAAIYLDGGFTPASRVVNKLLEPYYQTALTGKLIRDYKSELQELVQSWSGEHLIEYEIIDSSGPVHAPTFTAEVRIDQRVKGQGRGSTKKAAEQQAGRAALAALHSISPTGEVSCD